MKDASRHSCAICKGNAAFDRRVAGYKYYLCPSCNFLFTPGESSPIDYEGTYWENEYAEAVRREKEDCCVRAGELIYLSRIPVSTILDFGCGLGITVKWLRESLGLDAYGIDQYGRFDPTDYMFKEDLLHTEKFLPQSIDAILTVEVVEHLPQSTIIPIFSKLRDLLKPGGLILINSGTLEFTEESEKNQGYIDPAVRGHISIFSSRTLKKLAETIGLVHIPMWSRTWCSFFYKPSGGKTPDLQLRGKLKENKETLLRSRKIYSSVRKSILVEGIVHSLKIPRKRTMQLNSLFGRLMK